MSCDKLIELLPLALYAETHFRFFRGFPSLLFKREPEIIFDMPRRLDPQQDLPLILLANDIHHYPIIPQTVSVTVSQAGTSPVLHKIEEIEQYELDHPLKSQCRAWCIPIERRCLPQGEILINARLDYRKMKNGLQSGDLLTVLNDNLRTSSKLSFNCYVSDTYLPGRDLCTYGDMHCHSQFSRSHVEFGPPLEIIDRVAASSGIDFVALTDHSYDLACDKDDYLKQDQSLSMWKSYDETFNAGSFNSVMLQGEEVSCLNSNSEVVHLCALGTTGFIPGTLDGARKNRFFKEQFTINQAVTEIVRQGGYPYAAHPGANCSLLQKVLLHRGKWSLKDLKSGIEGVQALNGTLLGSWKRGKTLWIKALQEGYRLPLLAGNDSHGDFNRYRAIAQPFLKIHEDNQRFMGHARTGVYGKRSTQNEIIGALRAGKTFVTNGPFACISGSESAEDSVISTTSLLSSLKSLYVLASTTEEIGTIEEIRVLCGKPESSEEEVVFSKQYPTQELTITECFSVEKLPKECYLRMELSGENKKGLPLMAATSACFLGDYNNH